MIVRKQKDNCRWDDVAVQGYKADGAGTFQDITKQVLFAEPELACQLRYFEVAPGGHSSLERHEHVHAVMVVRGRGRVLVGDTVDANCNARPDLCATADLASISARR